MSAYSGHHAARPSSSPWTLWAWLMVAAAAVSITAGVVGGMLAPSVVLDIVSLWPLLVLSMLIAAALLPLRKRAPVRIAAALPMLLVSIMGASVVLHLSGWKQLPSSAANLVGPQAEGIGEASLTLDLGGKLTVRPGGSELYAVEIVRRAGSTGVPEALESQIEGGPFFVLLQEQDGGRWYQTAGWDLTLAPGPVWSLDIDSPDLDADLSGLRLRSLALGGGGTLALPPPGEQDVEIEVAGDFVVEVPDSVKVELIGEATVPGGWMDTGEGHRSPYGGAGLVITVVAPAQVEVRAS